MTTIKLWFYNIPPTLCRSNKGKMVGTKEEEEENEGLAMLIPDIQATAEIVHTATARIATHTGTVLSTCLL